MTNTARFPGSQSTSCRCRICLPHVRSDARLDRSDITSIGLVKRHGWQVTLVGEGSCSCCGDCAVPDDGPAFAYTVGLVHRAGHPELAMSGLPGKVMHAALNRVADRVVHHGLRVRPGDVLETVLANVPVAVDAVSAEGLEQIAALSAWFHRRPVEALQLVWPTTGGIFAWQPGAVPDLDELQPREWRIESDRANGLDVDPPWCLPIPPDALIVVCTHLREENQPVRYVARHSDEGEDLWTVHCGRDHGTGIDQLLLEHAAHTVRAAPTLRRIADLQVGEFAERDDAFSPWRRGLLRLVP